MDNESMDKQHRKMHFQIIEKPINKVLHDYYSSCKLTTFKPIFLLKKNQHEIHFLKNIDKFRDGTRILNSKYEMIQDSNIFQCQIGMYFFFYRMFVRQFVYVFVVILIIHLSNQFKKKNHSKAHVFIFYVHSPS